MTRRIGILTAGGDSPGLNAAIRAVGKSAIRAHSMEVIGFRDGFRGLYEDNFLELDSDALSGILTRGGTVLGTSRTKVDRVTLSDGEVIDGRSRMREVVESHGLEALVCLGGDGTMTNAMKLEDVGIPVLALPKTIDNDVTGTDVTFGFDTAMGVASEALDRLHATAYSHHRIMVVEIMGRDVGWLALGAGLSSGADVILIPEVPYDIEAIASAISSRKAAGSAFSIVAVAEGSFSIDEQALRDRLQEAISNASGEEREDLKAALNREMGNRNQKTETLAQTLQELTGIESRVTILGHVQRGGSPSPADRLLATRLGTACTTYIKEGIHGVMVGAKGEATEPVPLSEVAGKTKFVPLDHSWLMAARYLGIALGD